MEVALEAIATNHRQINSFGSGELYDIVTSGDTSYPLMYAMLENSTIGGRVESLVFNILIMDIVKGGRVNESEVASDMLEVVKDVISQLQHPSYQWEFDAQSVSIEPFTERFTDSVTGYSFRVTLLLPFAVDRCVIPYTPTSIPDSGCPVVTIYNSDGSVATTVSAGGSYTLSASGGSGGTYNIYVNGVLNQTGSSSDFSTETFNIQPA